jgi:flagellar basal-body rod modification protein FlgD
MGSTSAIASALAGTNTNTGTGNSSDPLANLNSNFTTFLNLLTTQLQHQDPTSPVDSTQFTQELVQFSSVEAQQQTNTLLQQILTATQGSQIGNASSYVGTTIQATGAQGGLVNGKATFGYTLAAQAATANVTITDSSGNVVFNGTGSTNAGSNFVSWDGTNSFTGAEAPDGAYTISVQAVDASGNAVTATPFISGTVTSASISNGQVMLDVGGLQVPASSVTSVALPNAAQNNSSSSSGS